ncbi:hypothetical protein V6N11_032015 [Hibiscus sabdariffa]|uniref:Uncharacterized protein n=1 Tax=Hibiscus sabdariffa TaxID=183260 RepID=A0ABR2T039_9ROSI
MLMQRADMIDELGSWQFSAFDSLVLMEGVLHIATVKPPVQDRLDEFMSLEIKELIYVNLSNARGFVLDIKECLASRLGDLHTNVVVRRGARSVIRWHRPLEGWCKLNSDGAVAPSSRESACGGVV